MIQDETPHSFEVHKTVSDNIVIYHELREFSQGGPEVGAISINGNLLGNYEFGGPCVSDGSNLFAPAFVKKSLGFGFQLAAVDMNDLRVDLLGKIENLIYLDKVENGRVYFFEDLKKERQDYIDLDRNII